jgi:cation:H+ antiporter
MLVNALCWIGDERFLYNLVSGLPTIAILILIAVSIVALLKGADWMVDGVVHLAYRINLPKIFIGATIVSLGTTTPEAFVSVMAAWTGNPGLALGNGVGSIIADTGLIFGIVCLFSRVPVNRFVLNRTGWAQVGSATLLVAISLLISVTMEGEPVLGRWVGFLFILLLVGYMYMTYLWSRQGGDAEDEGIEYSKLKSLGISCLMILGGLFLVILGARILIPCAASLANRIGVPDDVIAATMVAFGTSLPELMTAVAAVRKGHPEIMVGNIVGADVLNCFFVIGASAAAKPLAIPPNFYTFHFPAMILILYSFRYFIHANRDGWFKRWQGGWLLGVYLIYLIFQYVFNVGTV